MQTRTFPGPSILLLRENNYHIISVQESFPGVSDTDVLRIATERQLIILTFDKDYGEIIFKYDIVNPPSVIYFRDKGHTPLFAGMSLLKILQTEAINLKGAFTVIEKSNIRQRYYRNLFE